MNNDQDYLAKAKEFSQRGDSYASQGNYEYASNCYLKVAQLIKQLIKNIKKTQLIPTLKQKITKYEGMAAEMLVKGKEKQVKVQRSTLGFPTTNKPKVVNPISQNPVVHEQMMPAKRMMPNRKTAEVDKEVQNLIVQNIEVSFDDIMGMNEIKEILYETVILPKKRPDLFEGIRQPPRGILMYGPPGNGKTFIAKALARQSGSTFYCLSAASIMNKFVGESEKMLRKVFDSAARTSPSIIFIDEIDSMLTSRSQNENDSSRRLKTQFLVQFDGVTTSKKAQVVVIGATNLPNEIDLAVLRRFNKLVYIGLPDPETRQSLIQINLGKIPYELSNSELKKLGKMLDGYSASEIRDIIKQASMLPLRELGREVIESINKSKIRKVLFHDFKKVLETKKPLMTSEDLKKFDAKFH